MKVRGSEMNWFFPLYHLLIVAFVLFACWVSSQRTAAAHAILVESSPTINATVAGPNLGVRLRFNSRIDAVRSRLTLALPDGTARQLEIQPQQSPDCVTAQVTGLGSGTYSLRWQVLASDGHITRGEIPFAVN
jgi:methionine-rich copper-binding protein CopC